MGTLEIRSGEWRCRWTQEWHVGVEDLAMEFVDGKIAGLGTDPQGEFTYTGSYDLISGTVVLSKSYTKATARVPQLLWYIGNWDGQIIAGRWTFGEGIGQSGPFEMWPLDEEISLDAMETEDEEVHVPYSLS